ncbi:MAG: tetratricopeptide repeat protein [Holophagaceae bacterium]|nr:tetratricopeptide repeat protein [Holophagaceae bacterium]
MTFAARPRQPLEMGLAFLRAGRWTEAAVHLETAARQAPDMPGPRHNLGVALRHAGHLEAARRAFEDALEADPRFAPAWKALAAVLTEQGEQEAAWALRRRMEAELGAAAPTALLEAAVNYHGGLDRDAVFDLHKAWGSLVEDRVPTLPARVEEEPEPERRLRIGYVSPDLRHHACAAFIEPLWAAHDSAQVELHAYADVAAPDGTTARLRVLAHRWRDISGLAPDAVAAMIRTDRIDLLVDLAGHTHGRQLLAFARRPAPLQVAWLGYPGTTGLTRMDARLTDAFADPPGAESWHTERLIRLPGFLAWHPPTDAPAPGPLPMLEAGRCTFASFNNPSKFGERVVALWSRLLHRIPGSRLLLKARAFQDPGTRERWAAKFTDLGVPRDALEFRPFSASTAHHLAQYGEVDLALDPFPYNGVTTTCEALWMGVPVVGLAGDRHAARTGLSLLSALGRPDWAAADAEAWLDLAAGLAADPVRLARERAGLRAALASSRLCDGPALAASLEAAYRQLWRSHLEAS